MAALIALLGTLAATGIVDPLEEAASTVFGPVQRGLRQGAEPITNLVENVDDFDRVDDENRALRNRVEQVEAEVARLREEQIQFRGREALLAVRDAQADEIFLIAEIVTRDLTGLRDILGINKGSNDGIEEGMPVLAAGGSLVGAIMEVRPSSSFVRLISDPDSSVRVLHQLSRVEGVVNGDTVGNLHVEFIPQPTDVQPGHLFVTSGLGAFFPKALPVGRVASAQGSAQEVFKRIRLRPLAPLEQLESVLVQVTFRPSPLPPPEPAPISEEAPIAEEGAEVTTP